MFTVPPLQIEAPFVLVITGLGFTKTFTICAFPEQPLPDNGVTLYTTVWMMEVLFVITSLRVVADCVLVLSPVVLALSVAIQLKVAAALLVNSMLTVPPLQMVAVVVLVIDGAGFTVTVMICDAPGQLPEVDVGVTV